MQTQLKAAALVVAFLTGACGGGAHEHEPLAPADDGAWMDDATVVVERNDRTGRETVTLVDPASGRSLLVNDEPLTPERERGRRAVRPHRRRRRGGALELKENPMKTKLIRSALTLLAALRPRGRASAGLQPPRGARHQQRPGGRQHRRLGVGERRLARQARTSSPTTIPLEEPAGGPNFHASRTTSSTRSTSRAATSRSRTSSPTSSGSGPRPSSGSTRRTSRASPGGGKEFFAQLAGAFNADLHGDEDRRPRRESAARVIAQDVPVAPPNIGPRTQTVANALGLAPYTSPSTTTPSPPRSSSGIGGSEGRVFAGPRDDGFYVDLGGIFDLANLRAKGAAQDGVAGFNSTRSPSRSRPGSSRPTVGAPGNTPSDATTLGIWASASRRKVHILRRDG